MNTSDTGERAERAYERAECLISTVVYDYASFASEALTRPVEHSLRKNTLQVGYKTDHFTT